MFESSMNAERTAMLVIGATGHMWRVVVCGLASLGDAPASAEVAMVVEAAIRRLPSALPLRFADYDDACALKEGDDRWRREQSCVATPTP
jgi:hypothetical protein